MKNPTLEITEKDSKNMRRALTMLFGNVPVVVEFYNKPILHPDPCQIRVVYFRKEKNEELEKTAIRIVHQYLNTEGVADILWIKSLGSTITVGELQTVTIEFWHSSKGTQTVIKKNPHSYFTVEG